MTRAWPSLQDLLRPADCIAPVGLVGAPLAEGSVTPGRCDLAPATLRSVLRRISTYDVESGREIGTLIADHGDVHAATATIEDASPPLREAVARSVGRHALTLVIGGNNAVTRPGLLGLADGLHVRLAEVGLITLDAHFDMRSLEQGPSNGNPVRALREDGLPGRNIAQIGLAPFANSKAMHDDAREGGHLVITAGEVLEQGVGKAVDRALAHLEGCSAIYVDCDIDVIGRAEFPAAPGARAGGLAARDVFCAVRRLAASAKVRAIDLTEWDPPLDPTDLSALTAGRWLAEVLAGFERRSA